ncbi:MAG: hypothetical protein PHO37_19135 [Kiritimatiellae bacterium]|nr:hypothetical protein [Kiritimatiellia bacterium]
MTLQERLRESAKELVRLLEEDMKRMEEGKIPSVSARIDNGKMFVAREFEAFGASESEDLLAVAARVDRYLQRYPAPEAQRILNICGVLVAKRISLELDSAWPRFEIEGRLTPRKSAKSSPNSEPQRVDS